MVLNPHLFTRFDDNAFVRGYEVEVGEPGARKLAAKMEIARPFVESTTHYPTHPSVRPMRETAGGVHPMRSTDPAVMSGIRGDTATGDYRAQSYDQKWAEHTTPPGDTIPLFQHQSQSKPATVALAKTLKESRALIAPLLGIAQRDSIAAGEGPIVPSDDLSKHSARMVGKFNQNAGTEFHAQASNGIQFATYLRSDHATPGTEIPAHEVEAGRQTARRTLRKPKPPVTGEQLRLG